MSLPGILPDLDYEQLKRIPVPSNEVPPTQSAPVAPSPSLSNPAVAPAVPAMGASTHPPDQIQPRRFPGVVSPISPEGPVQPKTVGQAPAVAPIVPPIDPGAISRLWHKADNIQNPALRTIAKVGAGGARALQTIGDTFAPGLMQNIPGTDRNAAVQRAQVIQGQEEQQKENQNVAAEQGTEAETGLRKAQADEANERTKELQNPQPKVGATGEEQTIHDLMAGDNGQPRVNPQTGKPYSYLEAYTAVKQAAQDTKPQASATQEQNKMGFQTIIGKLDAAGLKTDPKSLDKSLDTALKAGTITQQEHATARGYESANPTPGTNLSVRISGQDEAAANAVNKMFEGKEVLAHMPDGRRVQMSYADAKAQGIPPERLVALSSKEAQETRDKIASTDATFQSLNNYRKDFKETAPQLTPADRDALRTLAAHTQDGTSAGVLGSFIDDLPLAGPLGSWVNKMLTGTITSKQYEQLSPAGKKLVSDYFTAVIANFANMKNIMGSVGRNPMQLQAEINTIPVPFLDWESANAAFENKRADLVRRAGSQPEIFHPGK